MVTLAKGVDVVACVAPKIAALGAELNRAPEINGEGFIPISSQFASLFSGLPDVYVSNDSFTTVVGVTQSSEIVPSAETDTV